MRKAILHIYITHNNVLMTATDLTGAETICKVSGGMVTKEAVIQEVSLPQLGLPSEWPRCWQRKNSTK